MINFQLGEPNKSETEVELPIEVTLTSAAAPNNITFVFTINTNGTELKVSYRYNDPTLLRVIEGGQTFQIEG